MPAQRVSASDVDPFRPAKGREMRCRYARPARSRAFASLPGGGDVDRAEGGTAEAVGTVHVLNGGCGRDIAAGRDGARDIGDGEGERLVGRARPFEGCDIA